MTTDVGPVIHEPACNDRCVGDSHWMEAEDDPEINHEPTEEN